MGGVVVGTDVVVAVGVTVVVDAAVAAELNW